MSADRELIDRWVRRFLKTHLIEERNLSENTQKGYRDSLHLLFSFISDQCRRPIDSLALEDITKERLKLFLKFLEKERGCSVPALCGESPRVWVKAGPGGGLAVNRGRVWAVMARWVGFAKAFVTA